MLAALNSCFGVAREIRLQRERRKKTEMKTFVAIQVFPALMRMRDEVSHHITRTALADRKKPRALLDFCDTNVMK